MQDKLRKRCERTTCTLYKIIALTILWELFFKTKPSTFSDVSSGGVKPLNNRKNKKPQT